MEISVVGFVDYDKMSFADEQYVGEQYILQPMHWQLFHDFDRCHELWLMLHMCATLFHIESSLAFSGSNSR